jgi:hypothetical protein
VRIARRQCLVIDDIPLMPVVRNVDDLYSPDIVGAREGYI